MLSSHRDSFDQSTAARVHEPLVDRFMRRVTDLRISLTRRCNFRCVYCHDEGLGPVLPARQQDPEEMDTRHVLRLVEAAAGFGIQSVKFTGGEPLLRQDLAEIVRGSRREIPRVSLTTNGSLLQHRAAELADAGLERVNISLDTVDPEAFRAIRKGGLAAVLRGIDACLAAGIRPVKLNMVVFSKTLPFVDEMLRFCSEKQGLKLQLIQFMPELAGLKEWMVDIDAVKRDLAARASSVEVRPMHRRRIYLIGGAEVEVVDPVYNREFCDHCQRLRVTEKGELKGCLNRDDDLIPTLGLDAAGLRAAFRSVVAHRVPYYGVYVRDFPDRFPAEGPALKPAQPPPESAQDLPRAL